MNMITRICVTIYALVWVGVAPAIAQDNPKIQNQQQVNTPPDIFSPINRAMFGFNAFFSYYIVDPTANTLEKVVPVWLKKTGSNFYENITEPEFVFTNLVDGHPKDSVVSLARLAVNSTIGVAGIFDVATIIGLKRRQVEISESFCNAGIPLGPYVVLPLVGPTNLFGGGLMGALLASEWYLLSFIDATIAAGDAILDTTVAAASLRHINDIPEPGQDDLYTRQQNEYWNELRKECPSKSTNILNPATLSTKS
ncbi:phospholipid-binding lipoprotein MlaA [Gammaproteobacteria bacterium]